MCDAFLGGASLFYDSASHGSATDFSDRPIKNVDLIHIKPTPTHMLSNYI